MHDRIASVLRNRLRTAASPIFHAGVDRAGQRVVLHLTGPADARVLVAETQAALGAAGIVAKVVVKQHDSLELARAKTLEQLLSPFEHDFNLFDPTAVVGRARVVVSAVREARAEAGKNLRGVFLDPVSRILYVIAARKADSVDLETRLLGAIDRATAQTGSHFNRPPLTVCIVGMLPMRPLVPVDRASLRLRPVIGRARGLRALAAGVAAALGVGGIATVAMAQTGPAVSGANAKIQLEGGYLKNDNNSDGWAGTAAGALTAPIGQQFGVQFDGAVGSFDGDFYWGAGGHLFWRDPGQGMLGVFGQVSSMNKASLYRAGVEGDAYLGRFTLGGHVGYQAGNDSHKVHVDDGVIAGLRLKYYVTDNFALQASGGIEATSWYGRGGFEYQPGFAALPGLSVFADAGAGSDHHVFALAGIRYYFGNDKTLIRRHREDDPDLLPLTEIQKFERKSRAASAPPYNPPS
jgi:hypothetical protein